MSQKEFTFTIGERLAMIRLYNEFKGTMTEMVQLQEDVKNVVITDEEAAQAEMKTVPAGKDKDGNDLSRTTWKDEGNDKVVSLSQESVDYLRAKIKAKNEAKEFTFGDKEIASLADKIN